jgi:hypothetical protein
MVRALAINDKNKPSEIPSNKWITKDKEYHITYVYWHPNQGVQGVDLKEINLEGCDKYSTFKLDRFGIHQDDIEAFKELCSACTEMNDVDILKLIEEVEIVEA